MGITANDVQRVAQAYIDMAQLQIVAVGEAGKLRDMLARFGKMEEYDAEGTPTPVSKDLQR